MKSFLRFLVFAVLVGAAVLLLFLWRTQPQPSGASGTLKLPALSSLDREFTALVEKTLPSVVSINAIPPDTADPRARIIRQLLGGSPGSETPPQLGSGAVVSTDGFIVTNWHVIQGAAAIEVHLNDGRSLAAKFVGAYPPSDIAILKVDASGLVPISFGDSDLVKVGQSVFAVGNPFGLQETVTQGIISAKGRRTMSEATNEFFQTDAPINPGNSGGPLVDLHGRLIGLNNSVLLSTDGIGFAIPSNTVRRVYESFRDNGRFVRPWFGVNMIPLTPPLAAQLGLGDSRGALVGDVLDSSPALRAGVKAGDVIVAFNNRPLVDWIDLRNRVAETPPGSQVVLKINRQGKEITLRATVEPQPGE